MDYEPEFARLSALDAHPRVPLCMIRTPLEPLPRLGERLGVTLYAKRDDAFPLAMGGNKVRQLEYYFGQARQAGADTVLITGAVQSNFVRLCAAAARKQGWRAIVQLENRVAKEDPLYARSGNVLLNRMLGADIRTFPEGENEAAADANLDRIAEEERAKGHTPYVVHLGIEHPPYGGLGYALCAVEVRLQCEAMGVTPDHIAIPSGSGLTHAGFLAGARAMGWRVPVHGVCVRREAVAQRSRITRRAGEIDALLGGGERIAAADIDVDDQSLAPGYGRMNPAVSEAIRLAAEDEALLLDPVYSGRTMAGLIAQIRSGRIAQGADVLFIHTGGTPAIFAYQDDLAPG